MMEDLQIYEEVNSMNLKELVDIGIKFHGHRYPAMPLGIRVGLAAMKELGVQRTSNKELFCFVETGPSHATMCFVDGIQVSTGCTYGKANIEKLNYGKNAIVSKCYRKNWRYLTIEAALFANDIAY